jgi:FMN phosphatase YigB (HAD superfamily)
MRQAVVLTDIDNTLYDWPAFYAPCLRAMIEVLSRELSVSEDDLYTECKAVFERHQSLEYAFLIQELASVRATDTERVRDLVRMGRGTFKFVQLKRLRPYPGVLETLEWLREQDVLVVGVTNSPVWRAQQRLYDLKLDALIDGLVAWEGFEASPDDPAIEGYIRSGQKRSVTRLRRVWTVTEGECKPNPRHYSFALEAVGSTASDAWAIGDSLSKDLEPAAALGIRTIWARYGSSYDPTDKNMATLLRVTHWGPGRINATYDKRNFKPDLEIDSFGELTRIIPAKYPTLF